MGAFALVLTAGALGAFVVGYSETALALLPEGSVPLIALNAARASLQLTIAVMIVSLLLFLWFLEWRVRRPLAALLRWSALPLSALETDPKTYGPYAGLAQQIHRLKILSDTTTLASLEEPAASTLAGNEQAASPQEVNAVRETLIILQDALTRMSLLQAEQAAKLNESSASAQACVRHLAEHVEATLSGLQSSNSVLRALSDETREMSGGISSLAATMKPELMAGVETLRAASQFLERHVKATEGKLKEAVEAALRSGGTLEAQAGDALEHMALARAAMERHAESLAGDAETTGKRLLSAVEDFRRAGQVLAIEASSVRGAMSDGVAGLSRAQSGLEELMQRLRDPDAIFVSDTAIRRPLPIGDQGALVEASLSSGGDEPENGGPFVDAMSANPATAFSAASDEIFALARSIERIEARTTALAQRLSSAAPDNAEIDLQTDRRADATIAALLGSIEKINAIAAAISEAGDVASRQNGSASFH